MLYHVRAVFPPYRPPSGGEPIPQRREWFAVADTPDAAVDAIIAADRFDADWLRGPDAARGRVTVDPVPSGVALGRVG